MKKYNPFFLGKISKCFYIALFFFMVCPILGWGQTIQIQNNQAYGDYWWTYPCGSGSTRAQSFTTGSSPISVTSIDVDLKYDSYSGNVSYEIWSNNNNGTTGTLSDDYPDALITNGASNSLAISSGWTTYGLRSCTFTTSPVLSANTKYWIIVKTTATEILVGYSTANASPWDIEENAKSTGTTCGAWTAAAQTSQDIIIDIYGIIPTNYYWNGSNTTALNGTWNNSSNLWSTPTKTTTLTSWPSASGSYVANFSSCNAASTVTLPGTIAYAPVNVVLGNSNHTFTSSATAALTSSINIGSNTLKMNPNASFPITLSGTISGTGGITNTTGTTILSGANTYSGTTTVTSGAIDVKNNTGLGTTAGTTTVASGAAVQIDGSGLTIAEPINTLIGTGVSSGGALRNLANDNTWSGAITIGTGGARINSDAGTLNLTGGITGSGLALTVGGAGNTTISTTAIATGAGTLTKDGAGILTLSVANTFTGSTTVSAGVLNIQNATATGTTAGGVSVTGGAALQIQGGISVGAEALTLNGTGISTDGALRNISGTNSWSGAITLGSATRVNSDAGTLTLSGAISGANALTVGGTGNTTISGVIGTTSGTLTKDGVGTLTLSAANTYIGATTINAGTVTLGAANALPVTTSAGLIRFAGGTPTLNLGLFNLGTSTASANSAGQLDFDVNTTVNLGASGTNTYYFKASNTQTWNATAITIYNWTGTPGSSGTGPKIYIGSNASGLTAAQLALITFNGYFAGATILSTGEVVPKCAAPTITNFSPTSACSGSGSTITINGTNFTSGATVTINGTSATPVTFVNSTQITVPLPAGASGTGNIVVTTCSGATSGSTFTVNPLPTISGTTTVCPNATTTLTGSITPGTWSSGNTGIATVNGSGVVSGVATGSATITYSVTATGCANTATVNVSAAPSAVTVTPSSASICSGTIQSLVASGGSVNNTILTENFNGGTNTWTKTNNSTGGTPANAAWTLRADGYYYDYTFHSNDNSQFYMSNSDAQGSGGTTATILQSPSFSTVGYSSATLSFYHYFYISDAGAVEYSLNGSTWVNLKTYTSTQGTASSFVQDNISLPAGALNQATVYIRFKYDATYDYYWAIDNVTISGSQTSTLSWSPTTELYTNAGATIAYTGTSIATVYAKPTATRTYTATATSGCSTSGSSTLTVSAGGVTINTQPVAATKCAGETATFTVSATSPVGMTYQWRKGGVNMNTTTYPSAATSTLTLTGVSASDAGNYDVVITPACGSSATSNAVALTVNPTATVTLASNSPAVAAASLYLTTTKNPIYRFALATNNNGVNATITQLTFTTTNSSASDITKYQLWYNSSDALGSATQIGTDITSSLGSGTHTFSSLSQAVNANTTGYFWITTDVASGATPSNTIVVSALTTSNITATYSNGCGSLTGSASAGGTQTIACYALSGTVSVGSGQSYTSLTGSGGLFAAINSCGLSGNLTVNITSNLTEDGTNALNQWTGAYTVTIQPSAASLRTISGSVSQAMIRLNGCDGLTIDGRSGGSGQYLKFKNTNTSYAVLSIANASTNNTIKYCLIESGYYGIYQSDATSATNTISNCSIFDFNYYGIYLYASTSTTISQNQIYQTSQKSGTCYGIYLYNAPSTIIEKNKIYDLLPASSSSAYGIYMESSSNTITVDIRNNMIALSPSNNYYVYGIYYYGGTSYTANIYFNSIYLGGTSSSAYSSYGISKNYDAATFNCKNNIVYNNRTASTANQYALYFSNTTGTINCDYNNLYSPTATYGYVGYWSSTACQTIASWRTASSKDASSINLNPNYTSTSSPYDLHLPAGSCKTGTNISGISDDYDSQSRTTPCIGADEVIVCSGTPTAGTALASSSSVCSGSLSTITVSGATTGYASLTYQWQSSADNSSWSDISAATGLSYSAYPTANTYYRRKITCSGNSAYSSSVLVSVLTCYTMDNTPVTTCSGLFYDAGGASADYNNSDTLIKTFTSATAGNALQISFSSFYTESIDKLYVYDGPTTASPQITGSPFSGSTLPATILSSGSSLTFKFTSDGSLVYAGWEASISCVPITVPNCATLASPTNGITTVCPGSGATLTWSAPTTGFMPTSYQVYFGTNNPPTNLINGTDMGNVTSYATGPLGSNTTYYWKIVPVNSIGVNNTCTTVYSFTTQNISITGTNSPVTTCLNTATLTATGGGTINWYSQPTGGSSLGTGGSFNPTFSGNTTYYVGASDGTTSMSTVGESGPSTTYHSSSSMGIRFTTYVPLTIKTVDVYVETANTNLTVRLQTSSGTDILTQNFTAMPQGLNTLTLNFSIPTAGDYILISEDGVSLGQTESETFPYTISGVISLTSSEWYGVTTGEYDYFYNWKVSAGSSCESARVPVNVIHTASPITITPNGPTTFALGGSVELTASSAASPGYTYTWTPSNGLNTTTGATVTATPSSTTTYTVVGTNGTPCTQTASVTVEVILPCTGLGTTGVTDISALPYSVSGQSLVGTGNEITSSTALVCGSTSYYTGEDAVYTFTPTVSGSSTIVLTATVGTYTGLMLYDGCPMNGQGGSCVSYSQSSTGSKSMCVSLNAGTTYYLVVDYYSSSATVPSNYSLSISAPDPSSTPNDLPCNAQTISSGDLTPGENTCATGIDEPVAPSCWTNGNINTVWYKLTTGASQTSIKIKTVVGTLLNTQMALYSGTCGSGLSMIACNDNVSSCGSSSYYNSEITATVTPNTTYYVAVDGYNDLTGTFSIVWTDGAAAWPSVPGQDCGTEIPVCSATFAIGNPGYQAVGNNCDFGTSYCLASGERGSAWYEIKINANGNLMFTIEPNDVVPAIGTAGTVTDDGTDYDWAIWQKTGSAPVTCAQIAAGTATPLRCNYSSIGITGLYTGGVTPPSNAYTNHTFTSGAYDGAFEEPIPVLAGETYYIVVSNFSNSLSGFTVNFTNSSNGFDFSIPDPLIWTGGAASTDWFDSRNWGNCAVYPDDTRNCVIAASSSYQPIINAANAKCKSITINPGAKLTINNGYNLDVYGNYINQGSLITNPTSSVSMVGGDAQTMDGIMVTPSEFNNLIINKTANQVTLNQNLETSGDLTLSSTGYGLNGNGNTISVAGNVSMANTTFTPGTGTFTIIGTSTSHTIDPGNNVFNNFTMNQTGNITLANHNVSLNSSGILTLTNGVMNTGAFQIIVNNSDPNAVNAGNSTSYINGNIRRYFTTNTGTYSFPVGTASAYRLAQIINNSMTGISYIDGKFSSTFTNTGSLNGTIANDLGTPYTSFASEGIWTLTPDAQPASGSYDINLWFNGGGANAFSGLTDYSFGPLKRANAATTASVWSSQGGSISSTIGRTVADGFAYRSGWNTFSEFGIGKASGALPISLLNAQLTCDNHAKKIIWATASELNNDYFSILSSTNAIDFVERVRIQGAGNSNITNHYQWVDTTAEADQTMYYQLKQTDNDGVSTSLSLLSGNCNDQQGGDIIIISNPNNPNIEAQFVGDLNGQYLISVVNYLGQIVLNKDIDLENNGKKVLLPKKGLASGLYNIVFKNKTGLVTKQVLITY